MQPRCWPGTHFQQMQVPNALVKNQSYLSPLVALATDMRHKSIHDIVRSMNIVGAASSQDSIVSVIAVNSFSQSTRVATHSQ